MMKIVYFGTDVFLSCFRYLADATQILALYTYHNDEDYFTEYGIVREAKARGIPVFVGPIDAAQVRAFFENEGCELFFSAEYAYVIPVPDGLSSFRGVNIHSSFLPEGRGYYPIEGAMERGLSETGVTMHQMLPSPDTGAVLFQDRIMVTPETDSVDVYLESSRRALAMTRRLFGDFDRCWRAARPQTCRLPSWSRPPEAARTLGHGMTQGEAVACYRRFNQMTLVRIGGRTCHVVTFEGGRAALPEPELEIAPGRFLYRVADGHLRLTVLHRKEDK